MRFGLPRVTPESFFAPGDHYEHARMIGARPALLPPKIWRSRSRFAEGEARGELKDERARVLHVIRAVEERDRNVDDGMPVDRPGAHRVLDPRAHGRYEVLAERAASRLVRELEAGAERARRELKR